MAHAYLDQLRREEAVSASFASDLVETLDQAAARLAAGARDRRLAARLEKQAAALKGGEGGSRAGRSRAGLAETLDGIAGRLRA